MSRARDRVQNRNETFFKSLISNVKLYNRIFKMLLLSSLHWERNFSVVNNGFFSSKIRFQKLVNLVSAGTKTASVTSYSLRGSISDKKPQLEQKPHLFVSPAEPIDSREQTPPRLPQAEHAGSSALQLSQLSGAATV